jgi:hypothetical protein
MPKARTLYIARPDLTLASARARTTVYYAIAHAVHPLLQPPRAHREVLDELNEKLVDKYFVQLLGVPVHAGCVGDRPDLPDHAARPPRRAPDAAR